MFMQFVVTRKRKSKTRRGSTRALAMASLTENERWQSCSLKGYQLLMPNIDRFVVNLCGDFELKWAKAYALLCACACECFQS